MQNNRVPITMPAIGEPIALEQIVLNTAYMIKFKQDFFLRSGVLHRSIETFYGTLISNVGMFRFRGIDAHAYRELSEENILEIAPLNIRQNVSYIIKLKVPHNFVQGIITNINSGGDCTISGERIIIHANISDIEFFTKNLINNADPRIMLPFIEYVRENPSNSNAGLVMLDAAETARTYHGGKRRKSRRHR